MPRRHQSAAASSARHQRGEGAPPGPSRAALSTRVGLWRSGWPRGLLRARAIPPSSRLVTALLRGLRTAREVCTGVKPET